MRDNPGFRCSADIPGCATDENRCRLPVLFFNMLVSMKAFHVVLCLLAMACPFSALAAGEDAFYKLGPDSLPQEGVPKGDLRGPFTLPSEVFPGTQHTYWVYVPAQYDTNQAAALMVFNDGQAMIAT